MMFATDLDRTLIFSKRALQEFPVSADVELVAVERKLNENMAFMTKKAYELLHEIASNLLFVPVTTRSFAQYDRLLIKSFAPQYAVTTNGANILYQGEPLGEWDKHLNGELGHHSIAKEDVITFLQQEFAGINGTLYIVENLFVYFYLNEPLYPTLFTELTTFFAEKGWKVSLQGRKLYFMPTAISKGKAVKFIQEREGKTTLIGAGDSLFDDDFLQYCHFPFVPRHGELAHQRTVREHYTITEYSGVKGGEELLGAIRNIITPS